jgi:hypothetical protein
MKKKKHALTKEQEQEIASARKYAEIVILRKLYLKTKSKHARQIIADKAMDVPRANRNIDMDGD